MQNKNDVLPGNNNKRAFNEEIGEQSPPKRQKIEKSKEATIFRVYMPREEEAKQSPRSPLKTYVAMDRLKLNHPKNTSIHGMSRKLTFNECEEGGIIKQEAVPLDELAGAKIIRGMFQETIGYKCLAPENSIVIAKVNSEDKRSTLVYSKYLQEDFATLYNEFPDYGEAISLRRLLGAPLWQEFLQYTALSMFVYGNSDMHSRNIGIVTVDGEDHIAAIDFGQIFYIATPESGAKALCQFLHMMACWHKLKGLNPIDIGIIKGCLSEFIKNQPRYFADLTTVLQIVHRDCDRIKLYGCNIEDDLPSMCMLSYKPNNKKQANPLVFDASKRRQSSGSLNDYEAFIKESFLANAALIPSIVDILKYHIEIGIEIRPYLKSQGIDIDYYAKYITKRKELTEENRGPVC